MEKIYDLAYEIDGDTISVEQGGGFGEVDRVHLHRVHVELLAGELGLLHGEPDAWRKVRSLERRLRLLAERIDRLDTMLLHVAEKGREDVEAECAYSTATLDLADEFVAELDDAGSPIRMAPSLGDGAEGTQTVRTPESPQRTQPDPKANQPVTPGFVPKQGGLLLEERT